MFRFEVSFFGRICEGEGDALRASYADGSAAIPCFGHEP